MKTTSRLGIYQKIQHVIAACCYYGGLVPFVRWLRRRHQQVVILNYHRAAFGDLSRHLRYLQRHYRVEFLEQALEELYAPSTYDRVERMTPPQKSVARDPQDHRTPIVITFDDGYYDNYSHAAKLAAEIQCPVTFFLVPGYMDAQRRFWWDEAEAMIRSTSATEVTLAGRSFSMAIPTSRRTLRAWIDSRLRTADSVQAREAFLSETRIAMGAPSDTSGDDPGGLPLGWREAKALLDNPFVSFGAHTMHHPVLACVKDPDEVRDEVAGCRAVLERELGRPIMSFAYPIGKGEDIDERTINAVQGAGYRWAVTTIPGYNSSTTAPLLLRRISTDPDVPLSILAAQAAGVWHVFALSRLFHWFTANSRRQRFLHAAYLNSAE